MGKTHRKGNKKMFKKRIEKLSERLSSWIKEFDCKTKSLTNAILSINEILKGHKNALGKHAGRLKRQGADIYSNYRMIDLFKKQMLTRRLNEERFQKRLKEEEEWTEAFKTGLITSAKCSAELLRDHNIKLDRQEKEIEELKERVFEFREENGAVRDIVGDANKKIEVNNEDIKEMRSVVTDLIEHLGLEIVAERNKDYMKRFKVVIKKKEAKK